MALMKFPALHPWVRLREYVSPGRASYDHTRGLEELTLRLEQQRERMAVVGAVARVVTVVAETLQEIPPSEGWVGSPRLWIVSVDTSSSSF